MRTDSELLVVYQCKNLGDSLLTTPMLNALLRNFEAANLLVICKSHSLPIFDGLSDRIQAIERPNTLSQWFGLFTLLLKHRSCTVFLPHASTAGLALSKLTGSRSISPTQLNHWLIGSVDISCPARLTPWRHTAEVNLDMLRKIGISVEKCDKVINPTGLFSHSLTSSAWLLKDKYLVIHPDLDGCLSRQGFNSGKK